MSILLIYLFHPRNKNNKYPEIDIEVKLLLFLYGIITLLTLNWKVFLTESQIANFYKKIFLIHNSNSNANANANSNSNANANSNKLGD